MLLEMAMSRDFFAAFHLTTPVFCASCAERVRRACVVSCRVSCRVLNVGKTADGKNTQKSPRTAARRAAELVVRKGRRKDEFRSFRCRALCRVVRMETLLPIRMRLGAHNTLSQTQRN